MAQPRKVPYAMARNDGIMTLQISASRGPCLRSVDSGFRISNMSGMEHGGLETRGGNENYVGLSDEKM